MFSKVKAAILLKPSNNPKPAAYTTYNFDANGVNHPYDSSSGSRVGNAFKGKGNARSSGRDNPEMNSTRPAQSQQDSRNVDYGSPCNVDYESPCNVVYGGGTCNVDYDAITPCNVDYKPSSSKSASNKAKGRNPNSSVCNVDTGSCSPCNVDY
jgi:hypothetical protein